MELWSKHRSLEVQVPSLCLIISLESTRKSLPVFKTLHSSKFQVMASIQGVVLKTQTCKFTVQEERRHLISLLLTFHWGGIYPIIINRFMKKFPVHKSCFTQVKVLHNFGQDKEMYHTRKESQRRQSLLWGEQINSPSAEWILFFKVQNCDLRFVQCCLWVLLILDESSWTF